MPSSTARWSSRDVAAVIVAMALGIAAVCVPAYVRRTSPMDARLFPWVRTGVESLRAENLVLLLLAGVALGVLFCRRGTALRPLFLGMATMALFPLFAIAEMVADPTSHNLWPFEFVMYSFLGLVAVVGAYVGWFAARRTWPGR